MPRALDHLGQAALCYIECRMTDRGGTKTQITNRLKHCQVSERGGEEEAEDEEEMREKEKKGGIRKRRKNT